jgi:hypothetical protein
LFPEIGKNILWKYNENLGGNITQVRVFLFLTKSPAIPLSFFFSVQPDETWEFTDFVCLFFICCL